MDKAKKIDRYIGKLRNHIDKAVRQSDGSYGLANYPDAWLLSDALLNATTRNWLLNEPYGRE